MMQLYELYSYMCASVNMQSVGLFRPGKYLVVHVNDPSLDLKIRK